MSTSQISRIWALLDSRKGAAYLALELVGAHSLGAAGEPPVSISHKLTGGFLVRIKILLDYYISSLARQDVIAPPSSVQPTGSLPDVSLVKELCFGIVTYILDVGCRATTYSDHYAEQDEGHAKAAPDAALHRRLAFAAFISAFRCLCLSPGLLSRQEKDLLAHSVDELRQVWAYGGGLTPVEEVFLHHLVPRTLEELGVDGLQYDIGTFGCGKFGKGPAYNGNGPICLDPGNSQVLSEFIETAKLHFVSLVDNLRADNWVESFWVAHDISCALLHASVRKVLAWGETHDPSTTSVDLAGQALWATVKERSESPLQTLNILLSHYFEDNVSHTSGETQRLFPTSVVRAGGDFVDSQVSSFEEYLITRGRALASDPQSQNNRSTRSSSAAGVPTRGSRESIIAVGARRDTPSPRSPDPRGMGTETPFMAGRPQAHSRISGITGLSRSTSIATTDISSPTPNRTSHMSFLYSRSPAPPLLAISTPVGARHDTNRNSGSTSSTRTDDRGGFSPLAPLSPTSETSSVFQVQVGYAHAPSPKGSAQPVSLAPSAVTGTTEKPVLSSVLDDESESRPLWFSMPSVVTPSSFIDERYPDFVSNPPTVPSTPFTPGYAESVANMSMKSDESKKSRFRLFRQRSNNPPPTVRPVTIPGVKKDLNFRFSALGSSLVLWEKQGTDFLVQLQRPFHSGRRLNLRPFSRPSRSPTADGSSRMTVSRAEAGDQVVAVVILEQNAYKLVYFDRAGNGHEIPSPRPGAIPIALAVSRDDQRIAVGYGTEIYVYCIGDSTHSLVGRVDAHQKTRHLEGNRRVQCLEFSLNSSYLVAATQEPMSPSEQAAVAYQRNTQVHVCLWRVSPGANDPLEKLKELQDVFLDLGGGVGDSGITSVFCSVGHPDQSRWHIFLTCNAIKPYPWILDPFPQAPVGNRSPHRIINIPDQRISNAAQAPGGRFVYKSGKHSLGLIDVEKGVAMPLISFERERGNMKMGQDGMSLAFLTEGVVLAFWKGWAGELVLKEVPIVGTSPGKVTPYRLEALYHAINGLLAG